MGDKVVNGNLVGIATKEEMRRAFERIDYLYDTFYKRELDVAEAGLVRGRDCQEVRAACNERISRIEKWQSGWIGAAGTLKLLGLPLLGAALTIASAYVRQWLGI